MNSLCSVTFFRTQSTFCGIQSLPFAKVEVCFLRWRCRAFGSCLNFLEVANKLVASAVNPTKCGSVTFAHSGSGVQIMSRAHAVDNLLFERGWSVLLARSHLMRHTSPRKLSLSAPSCCL